MSVLEKASSEKLRHGLPEIPPLEVNAEAVFDYNAIPYRVVVLEDVIQWQRESGLGRSHSVSYKHILGARVEPQSPETFHVFHLKMLDNNPSKSILGVFSFSSYKFPELAEHWAKYINHIVYKTPLGQNPPYRRLYVLVNPFSGSKHGPKIWKLVKPMFKIANIDIERIETTHLGHAEQFAETIPLDHIKDGIVCISGDGIISEILNGFMKRRDWKEALKIPIGIIPSGSGNGLAKSLGLDNTIYAAYSIITGKTSNIDVFSVIANNQRKFGLLSVSWGLMAAIDFKSEVLRFTGKSRFSIWAVNEVIKKSSYYGEISYYPEDAPRKDLNGSNLNNDLETSSEDSFKRDSLNSESNRYLTNEFKLGDSGESTKDYESIVDAGQDSEHNLPGTLVSSNLDVPPSLKKVETVCGPATNARPSKFNSHEGSLFFGPKLYYIPQEPVDLANWRGLGGSITFVLASNVTHISMNAMMAPKAIKNDGLLDLVVVRQASRKELLKILLSLEKGNHINSDKVEYIKVRSFTLKSNVANKDHLMIGIDGELMESDHIQVEVHQGLMTLFVGDTANV